MNILASARASNPRDLAEARISSFLTGIKSWLRNVDNYLQVEGLPRRDFFWNPCYKIDVFLCKIVFALSKFFKISWEEDDFLSYFMFWNLNEQRERTTNEYNCVIIWYQISVRNGISYSYLLIYFFEVFARARLNPPAKSDARILINRGWPYPVSNMSLSCYEVMKRCLE